MKYLDKDWTWQRINKIVWNKQQLTIFLKLVKNSFKFFSFIFIFKFAVGKMKIAW